MERRRRKKREQEKEIIAGSRYRSEDVSIPYTRPLIYGIASLEIQFHLRVKRGLFKTCTRPLGTLIRTGYRASS